MLTIWKENKLENEQKITEEEFISGFMNSPFLDYYIKEGPYLMQPLYMAMVMYVTYEDGGLNSTFENPDFERFYDRVRPELLKQIKEHEANENNG